MDIIHNPNFKSVELSSKTYKLKDVLSTSGTHHLQFRDKRLSKVAFKEDEIDRVFRVDKGHPNGAELHFVTKNGCIYICNERTMKLITVLLARRNQVERLYKACGLHADEDILQHCDYYSKNNLNK